MSILRSLQIGVSGLRSNSDALNVAGDNIANVNTVGFKRSRGVFEDILGRSITNYNATAGAGSRMAKVEQMWSQGALVTTDSPTDLAISGDGFFVVSGQVQGATGNFYTRAGQFHIDSNGNIVNPEGLKLQGYNALPNGQMGTAVGDLLVNQGTIPANPTTQVAIAANLDVNATVPAAWDPTNPSGTSNFSNNITAYDSLGNPHEITVFYRNAGGNSWEWHAMVDGGELTPPGGTAGTPAEGASGTLTFTTNGALDTETTAASTWNFNNATQNQAIAFDFGTSITTDGGTGLDGTTQFASKSTTNALHQDGYAAGSVASVSISPDGVVTGVFSNGQQRAIGQLVIAKFADNEGLARGGQGVYLETQASGAPLVGTAESGGRGSIVSGALEQSNVDMGTEFVNLISYQRGFQANSRVITTADEMYGELVNIKR